MFPELFTIGSVTIHTYGVLVALGILAAVALAEYLHRLDGGQPGRIIDMSLVVVLAGLVGARLVFVVINVDYYADNPLEILMLWKGGLVFYGGLIGGAAAFTAFLVASRMPLWSTLDAGAAALAIGHAMGRLGCFAAGCCYGRLSDVPWTVTFTNPRCLAVEVLHETVHPVQLYSFIFLSGLTGFLVWLHRRRGFPGQVAAVYLTLYSLFRFCVEFYRGDPRGTLGILGVTLTSSQWLSIPIFLAGITMYVLLAGRKESRFQASG